MLARIICNNFDYIHSHGIDLVRSLKLLTIRERRDYFLCVLMLKCIHGLAPHYLSNDVTMHVDIHMGMIQEVLRIWIYIYHGAPRRFIKGVFRIKVVHCGISCPPWVKESTPLNDFKHNYKFLNGWIHPKVIVPFTCTPISYHILMLLFYQFCIQLVRSSHIRNLSQSYHDIVTFMYDFYWWMCIYVFFISIYFTL